VVTSRVTTTRGSSATAGDAPASLSAPGALERYRVIVIGAPQDLRDADVTALERFMRAGGHVLLPLDEATASPALERLTGVAAWTESSVAEPAGEPAATNWFVPSTRPAWAEDERMESGPSASGARRLWTTAFGNGRLIVSGALDAWRYRDATPPAFDRFWQMTIAEAADASATAAPSASSAPAASCVRSYDDRARLAGWASSHGGATLPESKLAELEPLVSRALSPATERRTTHPMRSAWWIAPFALALGAEWILRRSRRLR